MSSILLRVLTKKSTLNFGKYKDCTVEQFIGMKKQIALISMYFKLSTISFNEEILLELGITSDYRIQKPSTDEEKYKAFIQKFYGIKPPPRKDLLKMKKQTKTLTKLQLQAINHSR